MANKELTSLAIRVFSIYVLVLAIMLIAQSSSVYNDFFQGDDRWLFIIPTLSIVGLLAVFAALWKLSKSVFNTITTENETNEKFRVDQVFILNLIGFYLMVVALMGLAQSGISLYFSYIHQTNEFVSGYNQEIGAQIVFQLIANVLKFIVGLTLLIRPYGWAKLLYNFRTFGLSNK